MFNIVEKTKHEALDRDGKSLADPAASSAEARKRAVLRSLGKKSFKPREWSELQNKVLEKVGPMRIGKKTTYRAMCDGKPMAEARKTRAAAKADVTKAIEQKLAKADKAPPPSESAKASKKEGES